jgi:endonuclease YncB( thermonuclease family)
VSMVGVAGAAAVRLTCPAALERVVDGDTLRCLADVGRAYLPVRVRLARVNAPELKSADAGERERARAAAAWLKQTLAALPTKGFPLTLHVYGADDWDRWVAEVELPDGTNLSDALLAAGHARPYAPRLMHSDVSMESMENDMTAQNQLDPNPQPIPPAPPAPPGFLARALGPTAGPASGNVRAIIAILSVVALHGLAVLLLMRNDPAYRDATLALLSALTAADVGFASSYFGKRQGDGA